MSNLLKETIQMLNSSGKTTKDVKWVGSIFVKTTWENFENIANKEYDSGFGGEQVNLDLMIVGDDWWLERHEYDGSEWWEYKTLPREPKAQIELKTVFNGDGYYTVLDANRITDEDLKVAERDTTIKTIVD